MTQKKGDVFVDAKQHEVGAFAMRRINERIRHLLDIAPSDASAELIIRKSRAGYKGLLKIYSQQRRFTGGNTGRILSEVFDRIFDEVRGQIDDWKGQRFNDVDPRPPL